MAISSTIFIIFFNLLSIQTLTVSSSTKCIEKERAALIEFKNSLTDGPGRLSSWTGRECCSWEGITCSNSTGHVLEIDLHNPTPFDIELFHHTQDSAYIANYSKTCLSGYLNPALLDLRNLQYLDLSYNNFSDYEIPRFFGEFESLRHLNLSVARFQGIVPLQIGNLARLQFLDMSDFWNNRLTSDSLKWASTLSSLRHLDLSGVKLQKANDWLDSVGGLPYLMKLNMSNTLIPSIFPLSHPRFTSLVSLDLQWNTIDSKVPLWLFNVSNLVELRLDGNGFYGPIPQDFDKLSSLSVLGLSGNFFNASVPDSLFTLANLSYLDLYQNRLEGTVPNGLLNLCSLKFFDLTQNGLTGGIPDFGDSNCLRDLEYLRLSYNGLNGTIPSSIGSLTSLRELDISNNHLTGNIPSSMGKLPNLVKLDVSNNSLSGIVTESHFAELSKLTELSMFENKLVIDINSNWIPPFQLQTIKLSSCIVGPLFPSWLRTQENVVELRMSRSGISDEIPDWSTQIFSRIHYLDVSKNNISGKLPEFEEASSLPGRRLILNSNSFFGNLRPLASDVLLFDVSSNMISGNIATQSGKNLTLEVLILSNNKLTGSLPDFLCEIEGLTILDVKNNRFSGRIPDRIGDLQNLAMLDLTNNTFHGEIPKSLAGLPLLSLHLHNNNFHGEIPSLENMEYLNILDVGKNLFTGLIPSWIGAKMQTLAFLSLQFNQFHGEIPAALCELPKLQLLNLAGNNISGTIPPCLGNISAMVDAGEISSNSYLTLDVDYGASIYEVVNGIERLYTTTMPFLTSLDLSGNRIVGEIPENLTRLAGLRNLNLAGNGLTGAIPEKIGEMKELISLDLSRNRISGRIPAGLSDLNFLSYLNLSFNDLSGRIPAGGQIRTMDPSSFTGNDELCGAPLARTCEGDQPAPSGGDGGGDDGDDSMFPWFYAGIGPGFLVGFLVVCGVLHFVKSWRFAFFRGVENIAVCKWGRKYDR